MRKSYFSQLASRPLTFSGKSFRFLICSKMAGRSAGIYQTEDPEEIKILDAAVAGRRGIREITEPEAEELKKKATRTLQSPKSGGFKPRLGRSPISPPLKLSEENADGAASGRKNEPPDETLLTKPESSNLIRIERVNPPKPFSGSDTKVERAASRAKHVKNAKIRVVQPAIDSSD